MLVTVVLVGLLGQIFVQSVACDGPLTPKGKGNAVVEKVVDMITNLKIFPSDHKFLCREAWVESNTERQVVPTGGGTMVEFLTLENSSLFHFQLYFNIMHVLFYPARC